jgi:hypothetical protein
MATPLGTDPKTIGVTTACVTTLEKPNLTKPSALTSVLWQEASSAEFVAEKGAPLLAQRALRPATRCTGTSRPAAS